MRPVVATAAVAMVHVDTKKRLSMGMTGMITTTKTMRWQDSGSLLLPIRPFNGLNRTSNNDYVLLVQATLMTVTMIMDTVMEDLCSSISRGSELMI